MFKFGSSNIGKVYFGNTEIAKAYLGSTKIYEAGGGPTPPSPTPSYDAEVEYLKSSGTQYIDTGIVPTNETGVFITFTKESSQDRQFCGSRNDSSNTRWFLGNSYYGWGGYGYFNSVPVGQTADVYLNYKNDRKMRFRSTEESLSTLSFTPLYNIHLFGINKWGTDDPCEITIHKVQITQGSNVAMDLIPVRVGTTGYMYDRVSGQLFGNEGTGDFVLGNDKTT